MLLNDTIKMCILLCINAIFAQLIKYEQSNCLIGILGLSSFSEMVAYLRLILDEGKITPQFWLLTMNFSKVTVWTFWLN